VKISRIPFALLLPVLELVIWVALVLAPVTLAYLNFQHEAAGKLVVWIGTGNFTMMVPRSRFFAVALHSGTFESSHTITALNVPSIFVELPITLATRSQSVWHPYFYMLDDWRALVWPIYCLPFWWFAGTGLDALSGRKPLRWGILLGGTLFFILFALMFCLLQFGESPSERSETIVPIWGCAFWAYLFAFMPAAWIRQWRMRKQSAPELAA
jgi:hypothetical protein